MYVICLIHRGQKERASAISESVRDEALLLRLNPATISITESIDDVGEDDVGVCLYLASREGAADRGCRRQIGVAFARGLPTFPLISEGSVVEEIVPEELHPFNALPWREPRAAQRVALQVLRSVGLTEFQRRIFISYRRTDSLFIGEELWEVLSQAGFSVFLDRFAIEPGANFQEKLFEALDEKSFLLLVESPDVLSSKWVEEEVSYARKRNMGLLVLTWPRWLMADREMPGIYDKYRMRIPDGTISVEADQGRLTGQFLAAVVDRVEERHAAAFLRRRRELMGSIWSALKMAGIEYTGVADWSLVAKTTGRKGRTRDQVFSITPRAPDTPDLYALDGERGKLNAEGVLVHTLRSLPFDRGLLLKWVIGGRDLKLVPEDEIVTFVGTL